MKFKVKGYSVIVNCDSVGRMHVNFNLKESAEKGYSVFYTETDKFKVLLQATGYTEKDFARDLNSGFIQDIFNSHVKLKEFKNVFTLFAFDKIEQKLLVAGDRLAVQPLFYHISDNSNKIVFSPLIPTLLSSVDLDISISMDGFVSHFGFGYHVAPFEFIYKGIKKVKPSEVILIQNKRIDSERYWTAPSCTENLSNENLSLLTSHLAKSINTLESNKFIGLTAGKDSLVLAGLLGGGTWASGSFGEPESSDVLQGKSIADKLSLKHTFSSLCSQDEFERYANHISYYSAGLTTCSYVDMCRMADVIIKENSVFVMGEGGECVRDFFTAKSRSSINPLENFITPRDTLFEILSDDIIYNFNNYPEKLIQRVGMKNSIDTDNSLIDFYRFGRMPGNFSQRTSILQPLSDKHSPFLDSDFMDKAYTLKPMYYKNSGLHKAILAHSNKNLLPFFENPDVSQKDCQVWEQRFATGTGKVIYDLLNMSIADLDHVFDKEKVLTLCEKMFHFPKSRPIYLILRVLSFCLYIHNQKRHIYYHPFNSTSLTQL